MNKDMIKAAKTVGIVLAIVVAVVGGMKVVSKFCCKKNCTPMTECCQRTSCECCEPELVEASEVSED